MQVIKLSVVELLARIVEQFDTRGQIQTVDFSDNAGNISFISTADVNAPREVTILYQGNLRQLKFWILGMNHEFPKTIQDYLVRLFPQAIPTMDPDIRRNIIYHILKGITLDHLREAVAALPPKA